MKSSFTRHLLLAAVSSVGFASPALAISDYFPQFTFANPSWQVGAAGTTYQKWDDLPAGSGSWENVTPTGSSNNAYNASSNNLALPTLSVPGAINSTPYIFEATTISATIRNYIPTDPNAVVLNRFKTLVQVQIAQTQGSAGDPFNPTTVDYSIAPNTIKIVADGVTYTPLSSTLVFSVPAPNGFAFPDPNNPNNSFPIYSDLWLFTFELNTGSDFTLSWGTANHSVFEGLRVDTLLSTPPVPEPGSLVMIMASGLGLLARRRGGVSH